VGDKGSVKPPCDKIFIFKHFKNTIYIYITHYTGRTCAIIILSIQHLARWMDYLGKEEVLTITYLDRFVNNIDEVLAL